ncbi:MAG TPA: O-antigen ligase family protein [Solirubrobacteraceae bacterium]
MLAFGAAAGLVIVYALAGGAYDIVVRQEYGLVLWWVLGIGIACGLLPRAAPGRFTVILLGAIAAYLGWTALSLAWTDSLERTTAELARVVDYVGLVALIAAVLDRQTWRAAAMGLAFAALLVCALAVASRLVPAAFPANPLQQANATNRLSYPLGYWNAVGAWAAMSIAMSLAWSAHDQSRLRRVIALGLAPVAALAAYLSYSRAGLAGAALGVVLVLVLSRNRLTAFLHAAAAAAAATIAILAVRAAPEIARGTGTRGVGSVFGALVLAVALSGAVGFLTGFAGLDRAHLPRRLVRSLLVAGAAVLAFGAVAFGPRIATKAWRQFRHPAVVTTTDPTSRLTQFSGTRYDVFKAALNAFTAHPITGTGAGTFEFWWERHQSSPEFVINAHSFELENMAELGAPGAALMVSVMVAALALLAAVRRRCRRSVSVGASTALMAAFAVYLLQASVDWLWQSTAVTVLAFAGVAVAGARESRSMRELRWPVRAGVAFLAACAALIQVPGLLSTAELRRSQTAERAGNAQLALAWAKASVSAEPWAASPYEQRGLVLESAGHLDLAAADLRRAVSHERSNFRHWLVLARIQTERGAFANAHRDYMQARQLSPRGAVWDYAPYFKTR